MTKRDVRKSPDATRQHGAAAIGGRLRRLSERIDQDCARVYADHGVRFEQRWLGVMSQLADGEPQSVGGLAASLGINQASVSETRKSLQKAGLIVAKADRNDARSCSLRLSAKGKRLYERLSPVWEVLQNVSIELNDEAGQALTALDLLDQALNRMSLYERVQAWTGRSSPSAPSGR